MSVSLFYKCQRYTACEPLKRKALLYCKDADFHVIQETHACSTDESDDMVFQWQ